MKEPDFVAMIYYLEQEGFTGVQIAEKLAISSNRISKIKNEKEIVDLVALKLLRLFLDNTKEDVPYIGDYHKIVPLN